MGRKVAFMADILDKTGVVVSNRQVSDRLWIIDIKVDALGADLMPWAVCPYAHSWDGGPYSPSSFFGFLCERGRQRYHYPVSGCWFRQQASDNGRSRYGCSLMGPIGHGWNAPEGVSSALLVAGGVGAAPLFLHAQETCCLWY